MSRRRRAERRVPVADPRYGSVTLASFINRVMLNGKKTVAQRCVYQALDQVAQETNRDAMEVFQTALRNVTPTVEVKPRRVGGATYQVPVEVPERRPERAGDAVAHPFRACARWAADAFPAGERDHRCFPRAGRSSPAPGRDAQDGGGEPGVRALPLVGTTR